MRPTAFGVRIWGIIPRHNTKIKAPRRNSAVLIDFSSRYTNELVVCKIEVNGRFFMNQFDYCRSRQAEQFIFYRIPKALFTDERFSKLSADAKVLYSRLLDRMELSRKNRWAAWHGDVCDCRRARPLRRIVALAAMIKQAGSINQLLAVSKRLSAQALRKRDRPGSSTEAVPPHCAGINPAWFRKRHRGTIF